MKKKKAPDPEVEALRRVVAYLLAYTKQKRERERVCV